MRVQEGDAGGWCFVGGTLLCFTQVIICFCFVGVQRKEEEGRERRSRDGGNRCPFDPLEPLRCLSSMRGLERGEVDAQSRHICHCSEGHRTSE